jgi:hypothetical protein
VSARLVSSTFTVGNVSFAQVIADESLKTQMEKSVCDKSCEGISVNQTVCDSICSVQFTSGSVVVNLAMDFTSQPGTVQTR